MLGVNSAININVTLLEQHVFACNETKLMHYSPVYSVKTPLHVSGLLVAHHQEVTMYICDNTYQFSHIYIVTS
jgi:hypothetical protein